MLPALTCNNFRNDACINAVLVSQLFLGNATGGVALAYLANGMCRQLRWRASMALPSLGNLISNVVCISAKEQVIGPNTGGSVASVQYPQPIGDRAVVQFPGNTMRRSSRAVLPASQSNAAVAVMVGCGSPQPTRIGLSDFRPKALSKRANRFPSFESICASMAAKAGRIDLEESAERGSGKSFAAMFAGAISGRIVGHRKAILSGVTPRLFAAARGFRVASIIPRTSVYGNRKPNSCEEN